MHLTAFRFGKPYESLERNRLVHFLTGEPVAEVSQVGGAIVGRDLRKAAQARQALANVSAILQAAGSSLSPKSSTFFPCPPAAAISIRLRVITSGKAMYTERRSGAAQMAGFMTIRSARGLP